MTEEMPAPRRRIVVVLNACRGNLASLELAASLAARRGLELEAVFVEDLNLLYIAELPFTKEVDRMIGAEREFDRSRVSRAHRLSLSKIRLELGRLSTQMRVQGTLTVRRGHFVPSAMSCARDVDLLVLGHRPDTVQRVGGSERPYADTLQSHSQRVVSERPVWSVYDGSERALVAVTAAAEIAAGERRPLLIAVPHRPKGLAQELQRRLASNFEADPVASQFVEVEPFDTATLMKRIRGVGCRMLVIGRTETSFIEAASKVADWPLVLV